MSTNEVCRLVLSLNTELTGAFSGQAVFNLIRAQTEEEKKQATLQLAELLEETARQLRALV